MSAEIIVKIFLIMLVLIANEIYFGRRNQMNKYLFDNFY